MLLASVPDRLKGETELLKKKLEWAEKKRLEVIEEAKKERKRIIREEELKRQSENNARKSIIDANNKLDKTVIVAERQQLEGI